jgi:hypothetical protein
MMMMMICLYPCVIEKGDVIGVQMWLCYSSEQITWQLRSLTLYIAAITTACLLLHSPPNGQAALYLFNKHSLCTEYMHSFSLHGCLWNGQKTLGVVACANASSTTSLLLHHTYK